MVFQHQTVRPSTSCYGGFSLDMDSSLGFWSTTSDDSAQLGLAFAAATPLRVNPPDMVTRGLIMQKACRNPLGPRQLVGTRFQVYFTPLTGVLFTFPSRYWFTIGHRIVFSLGGWAPRIQTEFHVFRPTWDPARPGMGFGYGAITLFGRSFQTVPLSMRRATTRSRNPRGQAPGFGLFRFRSPLLAESLI